MIDSFTSPASLFSLQAFFLPLSKNIKSVILNKQHAASFFFLSLVSPLPLVLIPLPSSHLHLQLFTLWAACWLEACHQRYTPGKYYCRSFNRKKDPYPLDTLTCDIFSLDFSCLPYWLASDKIHTRCKYTHIQSLWWVCTLLVLFTQCGCQMMIIAKWTKQLVLHCHESRFQKKGLCAFTLAFVSTQTICRLKIEIFFYLETKGAAEREKLKKNVLGSLSLHHFSVLK